LETGSYPGIVSDLIREVRDAQKVKEEATVNKIKAIIEEKFWASNENNLRVLRELEEVKVSYRVASNCAHFKKENFHSLKRKF
jgi:hypothetical protein